MLLTTNTAKGANSSSKMSVYFIFKKPKVSTGPVHVQQSWE